MIALVVGTRPEFVKVAPVQRALVEVGAPTALVHTGQHYDEALDTVFFRDLGLRAPDRNLRVGSAPRPRQVQRVRHALGAWLREAAPRLVVVQGDTNSVLGAALAAADAGIPLAHVEAGLRCGDLAMPEERNRRCTDHLADLLFAPTPQAAENLRAEGIPGGRVEVTGNTVVDELFRQQPRAAGHAPRLPEVASGRFALATLHRAENVEDGARLACILAGLRAVAADRRLPVLLPLHPRTRCRMWALGLEAGEGLRLLPPLGHLPFLDLLQQAALVLSDSGGVQEEACVMRVPCVTLRDATERPESLSVGASALAGARPEAILAAARALHRRPRAWENPFGDGKAGERIARRLRAALEAA